jgi:hypothetical protein
MMLLLTLFLRSALTQFLCSQILGALSSDVCCRAATLTRVGVAPTLVSLDPTANVFIPACEAWPTVIALLLPVLR